VERVPRSAGVALGLTSGIPGQLVAERLVLIDPPVPHAPRESIANHRWIGGEGGVDGRRVRYGRIRSRHAAASSTISSARNDVFPRAASVCAYAHCAIRLEVASSPTIPCCPSASPNCAPYFRVSLCPGRQMFTGREPVALLVVTAAIRQHEVVRQIHWVPSQSNKVIYMRCVPRRSRSSSLLD